MMARLLSVRVRLLLRRIEESRKQLAQAAMVAGQPALTIAEAQAASCAAGNRGEDDNLSAPQHVLR